MGYWLYLCIDFHWSFLDFSYVQVAELLEGLPASGHVAGPALDLLQPPDAVPGPRGVEVPHGPEGRPDAARRLPQQGVEAAALLTEHHAAPGEERVPVAVHQHALHGRLRLQAGSGAGAAHPPCGPRPPPAPTCGASPREKRGNGRGHGDRPAGPALPGSARAANQRSGRGGGPGEPPSARGAQSSGARGAALGRAPSKGKAGETLDSHVTVASVFPDLDSFPSGSPN